ERASTGLKRGVCLPFIFSRATRLFEVEQSRTNPESVRGCSLNKSNKQNTPNEKRTLSWTGCPQGLYQDGGSGGRAQGGSARDRRHQQRFARGGKMDWTVAPGAWQGGDPARVL